MSGVNRGLPLSPQGECMDAWRDIEYLVKLLGGPAAAKPALLQGAFYVVASSSRSVVIRCTLLPDCGRRSRRGSATPGTIHSSWMRKTGTSTGRPDPFFSPVSVRGSQGNSNPLRLGRYSRPISERMSRRQRQVRLPYSVQTALFAVPPPTR